MSGFAVKRWQTALVAFFTIAASLLAGCSKATDARLVAADSLMAVRPDSALAILQAIAPESLRGKANNAYYALLLTQAQYKNYVPITSDSLIDVAVRYYDNAGDAEKRTRAYIFKGAALNEMGDHLAAIEWYKKAETVADTGDYENLGYIHMRLGELYKDTFIENGEDIANYKEALRYYRLAGDTKYQQVCLSMIGGLYRKTNLDSAYNYLNAAFQIAKQRNDSVRMYYNLGMLARTYFADSQTVRAKDMAVRIIREGRRYLTDNNPYYDAANAYARLGMVDSAKYYYRIMPKKSSLSLAERVIDLNSQTFIHLAEKKYFEAFKTSELCNSLADSVTTVEDKVKLFEYEKKYDKSRLENENLRIKNEKTWLYLLLTIGVILLLVAYLVIHKRTQQTKKSLSIISQLQEETIAIKQDIVLQKISEMKIKKAMESQFDNIRKLIDLSYNYEGKPTLFMKAFRQQIKTSKSELSSNLMKDIRLFVDLNYNNFISIISDKYPFLKDDELMIISLLRCGFSYIEISICMGYDNFDYVNTKKLRIAKKMGLTTSLKKFIDDYSYD